MTSQLTDWLTKIGDAMDNISEPICGKRKILNGSFGTSLLDKGTGRMLETTEVEWGDRSESLKRSYCPIELKEF